MSRRCGCKKRRDPCDDHKTLTFIEHSSGAITIGDQDFRGTTFTAINGSLGIGVFDTPLFNCRDRCLVGRLEGNYDTFSIVNGLPDAGVGIWNFYLDDEDSWISAQTGFDNSNFANYPITITGGTGIFEGIVGTVEHKNLGPDPNNPSVTLIKWTLRYKIRK